MTDEEEAAVEAFLPRMQEIIEILPPGIVRDAWEAAKDSLSHGVVDEHTMECIALTERTLEIEAMTARRLQ